MTCEVMAVLHPGAYRSPMTVMSMTAPAPNLSDVATKAEVSTRHLSCVDPPTA